jgi:hypothetical protein
LPFAKPSNQHFSISKKGIGIAIAYDKFAKFEFVTYQVDILNPKADRLLKDLADLKLIAISKTSTADPFLAAVKRLRKKAAIIGTPTLEEITKEVEIVRAKRYASQNKN